MILQNFVPHQSYYGREPAQIAGRPRTSTGGPACGTARTLDAPSWACEVTVEDMKRLIAETRRLMPDVGIQVPPNLSDWWPELVRAGATDLGGLSANGDHISPEHPFPSPTEVRKRLRAEGVALSERLCVYPEYIDPEWISGRCGRDQGRVLVVHPAAGIGPAGRSRSAATPRLGPWRGAATGSR